MDMGKSKTLLIRWEPMNLIAHLARNTLIDYQN